MGAAEPAPVPVRRPLDVSIRHCVQLTSWPNDALSAFEADAVTAGAGLVAAPRLLTPASRGVSSAAPAPQRRVLPPPFRVLTSAPGVVPPRSVPPAPLQTVVPAPLPAASSEPRRAAPPRAPRRAVPAAPVPTVPRPSVARPPEPESIDAELIEGDSSGAQALEAQLIPSREFEARPVPPQAPSARPAAARPPLLRQAALDPHQGKPARLGAVEPPAGAGSILLLISSLVAVLLVGAGLLTVEMAVEAPGALRAPNGLRSVASVLPGAVTDVLLHAGDDVTAGQVVVRLEEMHLRASLTLREQELAALQQATLEAARADQASIAEATLAMQEQRAALERRRGIHRAQLSQRAERLGSSRQMLQAGVASTGDTLSANESVQAAAESVAVVAAQAAELALAMADRRREWKQRELERASTLQRAIEAVEEARSRLAMTEIRSPASGRIEALFVNPGSVVQAGAVMAQIVPRAVPRAVVAFLPSRETASVAIGTEVNVEVVSLPVAEFGMARARVTRISTDRAKPEEMASALGEALPGPFVRVDLLLIENDAQAKMAPHIRSGERVTVRLQRREQRIISLVFEFVKTWLGR